MSNTDYLALSDEDFLNEPEPVTTEPETAEEAPVEHFDEPDYSLENEEITVEELDDYVDGEEEEVAEGEEEPQHDAYMDVDRVMQPFKANGKDVQVRNVDEAIQLMQMGANYTQKMQSLAPNLKLLKTLEANELLDQDKLNFLIDLSKKDPKAISKLVKDAELDPLDMDLEDTDYTPNDHQIPDQAIVLDEVLSNIETTPTYNRCIDVVGNTWDQQSRTMLSSNPQMIAQINEQMQLGIFDMINQEVEHVKMFGGLTGMSDFDAYRAVGKQMYDQGAFNHVNQNQPQPQPLARTQVRHTDAAEQYNNQRRRAAATPKQSRSNSSNMQSFNPLAMSDEEFLRINNINL